MHVFQPCKLNTVAEIKLMCTGLVYIKCIRHYLWIHTLNDLCSVTDLLYTHTHMICYIHICKERVDSYNLKHKIMKMFDLNNNVWICLKRQCVGIEAVQLPIISLAVK